MVGVAGGVPSKEHDIRLGDVVISEPSDQNGGVIQYLFGKTGKDGKVKRTGWLNSPPPVLLTALKKLRVNDMIGNINFEEKMAPFASLPTFQHQTTTFDTLYEATHDHVVGPTCDECGNENVVQRIERQKATPILHYGTIASDNQVMKDAETRDKYSKELGGILCFEMEAAGIMNTLPCLVIRGICDYSDFHKNKRWQPYASATAAVVAKELLKLVPTSSAANTPTMSSVLGISEGKFTFRLFIFSSLIHTFSELLESSKSGRNFVQGSSHQTISNGGVGYNGDTRFSGSQTIGKKTLKSV